MVWQLAGLVVLAFEPCRVNAIFDSGYTPPPPKCPERKCEDGMVMVGKLETEVISYGCPDAGMNFLSMADFDPNNPYASMNKRGGAALNKCCLERDICKQTCGMTAVECFEQFQKCSQKVCKADQNCKLQAMISEMSSDPFDNLDDLPEDYKYDPEESKCRGYMKAQENVCQCVPKADVDSVNEEKLKQFYAKYNTEKLDSSGGIKDAKEVWGKWKGKEPAMFSELAKKYKDKVVQVRTKPKPKPRPPKASKSASSPQPSPAPEETDVERKLKELEAKKNKAKQEEDYDRAAEVKEEMQQLKQGEVDRLQAEKAAAVELEDYALAKKLKNQLARLQEL